MNRVPPWVAAVAIVAAAALTALRVIDPAVFGGLVLGLGIGIPTQPPRGGDEP